MDSNKRQKSGDFKSLDHWSGCRGNVCLGTPELSTGQGGGKGVWEGFSVKLNKQFKYRMTKTAQTYTFMGKLAMIDGLCTGLLLPDTSYSDITPFVSFGAFH